MRELRHERFEPGETAFPPRLALRQGRLCRRRHRRLAARRAGERDGQLAVGRVELLQPQDDGPESQPVSRLDPAAGDALAVDEGAVLAPQVFQAQPAGLDREQGMAPRHAGMGEDHVAVEAAADAVEAGTQEIGPAGSFQLAAQGERTAQARQVFHRPPP
jgi:hypothetical protein